VGIGGEPYRTGGFASVVVAVLGCLLLTGAGAAEPPSSARPVVLVHGFDSHPDIWRGTERLVREAGRVPILLHWRPNEGAHSKATAIDVVLPAIREGLVAAGFAPDAPFDVVTHSLGGLLMRQLLEHPDQHDDPSLPERVGSLAMLSPPHQGARTGIAAIACGTYQDPAWREIVCDLMPDSEFLQSLGDRKPIEVPTRYLSIGVATGAPFIPAPPFDGDGDGRPAGHDNAVMAESGWLPGEGSAFVVWRGWDRHDHFNSSCSAEVNRWILGFLTDGAVPEPARGRVRGGDACEGLTKAAWREQHGYDPE
jgi:pimeloyl-ACP methyl ester carboxylesterase